MSILGAIHRCQDCRGVFFTTELESHRCDPAETFRLMSWLLYRATGMPPSWRLHGETMRDVPGAMAGDDGVLPAGQAKRGRAPKRVQGVPPGATQAAARGRSEGTTARATEAPSGQLELGLKGDGA